VPKGTFESGSSRYAIVVARFNSFVVDKLLEGAQIHWFAMASKKSPTLQVVNKLQAQFELPSFETKVVFRYQAATMPRDRFSVQVIPSWGHGLKISKYVR